MDTAEGDISLYTQGDFTDLCRGPHLQDSRPIKAFKLTGLAGRVLARGREEHAAHADLRDGVLHAGRPRRVSRAARGSARATTTAGSGRSSTSSTFDEPRRARPFWHPKGMTVCNVLEDLRRGENARRGYLEVKTPLIYDKALWETSGHWEKFRGEHVPDPPARARSHTYGLKPMNCPGHMLLFGSQLRSYRDLPAALRGVRRRCTATSPPGRCTGSPASGHVTQDDAHIFCTEEQIDAEIFGCLDFARVPLRPLRDGAHASSSRPGRTTSSGPTRSGTSRESALRCALERHGIEYYVDEGERRVLRAEDRPAHERRRWAARGRWGRSSSTRRCRSGSASPTWAPTTVEHTPYRRPSRALRLVRAVHGDPDRALRRRVPRLAGARAGAGRPGRRRASDGGARAGRRAPGRAASGSRWTSATRRSASGSATRSCRRCRSSSSGATGSRRDAIAVRKRGAEGVSTMSLDALVDEIGLQSPLGSPRARTAGLWLKPEPWFRATRGFGTSRSPDLAISRRSLLRSPSAKQERHRPSPRRPSVARGSTESDLDEGDAAAACSGVFSERGGSTRLGERPLRPRRRPEDRTRPVVQHDRINEQIRVPRVRLVDEDGEQIGIKDTKEALEYAYSKNLDLVEVAASADPPVARVMDYGKWRYEQEQRAKQARKHQSTINIKEIKLRPKIGVHDYETKKGHVVRFLQPAGEGEGHDHVPGAGEPASGAWSDASRASRRGRQGDRADRAAAHARRPQHDHGARADEERRSETRCRR